MTSFSIRLLRLASPFAALVVATGTARADFTVLDDFNDGALDGWNLFLGSPAFGTITPVGGRMLIRSFGAIAPATCVRSLAASFNSSYGDPADLANGAFRFQFQAKNATTAGSLMIRDGADLGADGYAFTVDAAAQRISIRIADPEQCLFPPLVEAPFPVVVGADYQVEAVADGPNLSMKVWAVGASQPGSPQLTAVDDTFAEGGLFLSASLLGGVGGQIDGTFDNLLFKPLAPSVLGDLNGDQAVDGADLAMLLGEWGASCKDCPADLDGDGLIDAADLALLLGNWGS